MIEFFLSMNADAQPYDADRFQAEIARAERARAEGNEGMARVCARRAAGLVARAYLKAHRIPAAGTSAYDSLRSLAAQHELNEPIRRAAEHMLLRITQDHELPVDADLIAEARTLRRQLFPDDSGS